MRVREVGRDRPTIIIIIELKLVAQGVAITMGLQQRIGIMLEYPRTQAIKLNRTIIDEQGTTGCLYIPLIIVPGCVAENDI